MNVRLLRKIAKHISEEPRRFMMNWWIARRSERDQTFNDDGGGQTKFARCGTAACIAGWACALSKGGMETAAREGFDDTARGLLGIDEDGGDRLFGTCAWPEKFCTAYAKAETQRARAKIAVARIEHFIATKGQE